MLYLVEVRNSAGALLSLPMESASSGYFIDDITGLDPVKATLVTSSFARLDGLQYHSSRRDARNIVMKLTLEPLTDTIRTLRRRLYQYMMPKSQIRLRFYTTDGLTVEAVGRVESFEAPLFTKDPQVQVSVMCFDPDFLELDVETVTGMLTDDEDPTLVTYEGTVDTGIVMRLLVNRSVTEFTVYHKPPDDEIRQLDFAESLVAGDVVTISTVPGNKYATLTREGADSPIVYAISPQSNWTQLVQGVNEIRAYAEGGGIPFEFDYINRHGGL